MVKTSEFSSKRSGDDDAATNASIKFKGELAKAYESESSDSDEVRSKPRGRRPKMERPIGRPKNRISNYVREVPPPTFVMKLFDRSVDLTKFVPESPLYPICRAWFRNNPKEPPKKDVFKRKEDKMTTPKDVFLLPQPVDPPDDIPAICCPPDRPFEDFSLEYDPLIPLPLKEELLENHVEQWQKTRAKFRKASFARERRYNESLKILRGLLRRS